MAVAFVYTDRFSRFDYGPAHPLRIERLGLTVALMREYGLLDHPELKMIEARPAKAEELISFHHPDYLAILHQANLGEFRPGLGIFGFGYGDNPVFRGVYDWATLVAGASLQACREIIEGRAEIAFNISGGMHHAGPSLASGFCYINDAAVAILELVRRGFKVAYVDLDAHHGDGVQNAFYESNRVLTISLHQTGLTLFPGTGFVEEQGQGPGRGFAVNIPLLPHSDDEVYTWAFDQVVPPLLEAFRPDVLVSQLGLDGLHDDPLANLQLTDRAILHACAFLKAQARPWLALGGGGYNVVSVALGWTLVLALMLGVDLPDELPPGFYSRIERLEPGRRRLRDQARQSQGLAKAMALEEARRVVAKIRREVFPVHGL